MRKHLAICVALAFLLFTVGLLAQNTGNSGQDTNPSSGTNSSQNPNSPAGDRIGSWQSSASSSSTHAQSNYPTGSSQRSQSDMGSKSRQASSAAGMNHQENKRTVEGCVVHEQIDYFLIPKSGTPVRLNSGTSGDLSQHVGHRVKLQGNETAVSNAGAGMQSSATAGAMGAAAGGSTNTMGSATAAPGAISENPNKTTNPQPGEPSTESSTQGQNSGSRMGSSSGSGDLSSAATQEIVVDRLTLVSKSCPANWNPLYSTGGK
jgi:hypothetical protein